MLDFALISLENSAFLLELFPAFYGGRKLHKGGLSAGLAISKTAIALDGCKGQPAISPICPTESPSP
jgi:hypothetical protein